MSPEAPGVGKKKNAAPAIITSEAFVRVRTTMAPLRRAEVGMLVVAGFAAVLALALSSIVIGPPSHCPLPVPPIVLRTVSGSGELVFLTVYSTYTYAEGRPQAPVADLRFELAEYHPGDNYGGPGAIAQSGPLSSPNRSASLQFHDMAAEGEFSPRNDFLLPLNAPNATVQLRIIDPVGHPIAWNMIMGCA